VLSISELTAKKTHQKNELNTGLSEKEVRRRLEKYGPNIIMGKKKISVFRILMRQFTDFMVIILLASTAISMFMGEMIEAFTIMAIVAVNAFLGFIQEYRTEKTLEALKGLAAPSAKVIRGGKHFSIAAQYIVPGDLVLLEAGDRVPADAILVDATNLQADESILTGESVPVEKSAQNEGINGAQSDRKNMVYMGTIITSGRATAFICATGMETEMGKIADMIQAIEDDDTPLQKKLNRLGKYIVLACIVICAIVSLTGVLRGEDIFTMFLAGISLAVAAVPEGLPAIVTVSLALGMQRMLKRHALIRKLPAVETLGCASVICSDKTGTLTENKMTVRKIFTGGKFISVKGTGYSPEGSFHIGGKKIDPLKFNTIRTVLEISGLCNNSQLVKVPRQRRNILGTIKKLFLDEDLWCVNGDPTEGALLVMAAKAGLTQEVLEKSYSRVDEVPFDPDRKCMSVVSVNQRGETFVFTKGAPDIIIDKCTKVYTSKGIVNLNHSVKTSIININNSMAAEALRVLGVACRKLGSSPYNRSELEKDLIFVGLVGMIDPPRKEALEAVQKCRMAGIKPVMITGDHKITATAIAKELNIYIDGEKVVTGSELERMSEGRLKKVAGNTSVYARVSPRHKLMIVKALKKLGHIVAMTGDGVNDAPAIKEADIGISMGITGTDVTKEASSMILMDDNFASIVAAVEEGRVIYSNIRKFIRYLLACNIGEVLTMFLGTLAGLPIPLLPIQILWVNLITDGLPAIALGMEPPENDIMMKPPRSSRSNIFSDGLLSLIVLRGILLSASTLAVFASILYFTRDIPLARTGAFVTLVLTQLTHVFECKSESKTIFEINIFNNIYLIMAVLCSLTMILLVIYLPFLQPIFKTSTLTLNEWLLIGGFSSLGPVISSLFRSRRKRVSN
jgi:Ca2+-transporting ATPase